MTAAWIVPVAGVALLLLAGYALFQAAMALKDVKLAELVSTMTAAGATFVRVVVALLIASLWTIPAGVAIGFNRKLARVAQRVLAMAEAGLVELVQQRHGPDDYEYRIRVRLRRTNEGSALLRLLAAELG